MNCAINNCETPITQTEVYIQLLCYLRNANNQERDLALDDHTVVDYCCREHLMCECWVQVNDAIYPHDMSANGGFIKS